jgi:hypothetical protein
MDSFLGEVYAGTMLNNQPVAIKVNQKKNIKNLF